MFRREVMSPPSQKLARAACRRVSEMSVRGVAAHGIVLKNSVLKPTVIADSFRPVGAGDRIDDGSAAG